jgi:hypothetical protein
MNNFATKLLIAGLAVSGLAQAQDAAQPQALVTAVVRPDGVSRVIVLGGDRSNVMWKQRMEMDPQTTPLKSFPVFYLQPPADFTVAMEDYQNNKFQKARNSFNAVKKKYQAFLALPNNHSQEAAFMELNCAVEMQDWPAVKGLTDGFPKYVAPTSVMTTQLEVNSLLGKLAGTDWDDILTSSKVMLAQKKKWSLKQLAQISYARGVAFAAKNDNAQALENLATAIVAQHGSPSSIASSALLKSVDILLQADPKVAEFIQGAGNKQLSPAQLATAPLDLKEAAAYVFLHKNVYFPNQKLDPKYENLLRFFSTPAQRTAQTEKAK